MTTLPDWLEEVDSYDKATGWPGAGDYHLFVESSGQLRGSDRAGAIGRQWVRVRSYREGVEAAIAALMAEYHETKFRDGAEKDGFNLALKVAQGMLAPPKPPLKFGEMVEALDSMYYDAVVTNIGKGNGWFEATRDGGETVSRRINDENKTWRRKS